MNHSKIVREIFGKDMEAAGYTYIKGIPNHYPYVKEKGNVKLEIAIDKSRFITEVRMLFRSNAYAVQEKVNELRGKPFEEAEETLIGLAAVYGHYMCLYGIGRWEWVEEYQRCDVCDLGGTKYGIAPLDDIIVIYHCEPDDIDDFIEEYANLLHDRNEAIEYGDIEGEIIDVKAAVAKAYE